jgi:hypothetical protein
VSGRLPWPLFPFFARKPLVCEDFRGWLITDFGITVIGITVIGITVIGIVVIVTAYLPFDLVFFDVGLSDLGLVVITPGHRLYH